MIKESKHSSMLKEAVGINFSLLKCQVKREEEMDDDNEEGKDEDSEEL